MGIAGANYGYALMWVLVGAILMRFLFVSLIARYQLSNQHGEGVLDGLARLHRWYAPILFVAAILMGHIYESYMTVGAGEVCRNLFGVGQTWQWALFLNGIALLLVFRPSYQRLELVFKVFLGLLAVSFVGSALWVGCDVKGLVKGLYRIGLPDQRGHFNPLLIAVAMIGAVGGSLMNLAVWTLGAELLYPDKQIQTLDDLPKLLTVLLGRSGGELFYLGIFAAIYTSILGHAAGLAFMGSHAWLRWQAGTAPIKTDYRQHPLYRWIAVWCLVSPLIWTIPGMPDFVTLTLIANSAQVVLLPLLAGGLWWITASPRFIGAQYRNRWWENVMMALLFALAIYGAINSIRSIAQFLQ
jgi:Mn2+/Fe2+ NRAMP family transporter